MATADGLSIGSLHVTLVHILVAELVWLARWEGGLPPEELKDARIAGRLEVTDLWRSEEAKQHRFFSSLTDDAISKTITDMNQYGEPNEQPLSQLIAHVVNHGTQFRAEAAVRLTQLGLSSGDLDLIIFLRQRARPRGTF